MHANRLMPNVYRKKLLAFTISELPLQGRTSGSVQACRFFCGFIHQDAGLADISAAPYFLTAVMSRNSGFWPLMQRLGTAAGIRQ